MATQTITQAKSQPKLSDNLNTFVNMRKSAKAVLKQKYTGSNGFEAWQELGKLTDDVLTRVSREEVIATFYRLAATNAEIAWFISEWGK